jgi:prevent-host-death family protein
MREVGTLEARNSLSALLELVEKGEEITITRHGKAVARLVPAMSVEERRAKAREAAAALLKLRDSLPKGGPSVLELIEEGRHR